MKLLEAIKNPKRVLYLIAMRGGFKFINDELYLKIIYRYTMGKKLNLDNPITFNEKLQWLKIHDRNPHYTTLVDKYGVKEYIKEHIGEEYIIPTLGVWDNFDEIDFDKLPQKFVLKCTHDSGGVIVCRDKSKFDVEDARKKINKALKRNYYWPRREWPYKNVIPRIIAEKYMVDEALGDLRDYKFFCFDGKAKAMYVAMDRNNEHEGTKFNFYDMDFNLLPITKNEYPNSDKEIQKPENFEKMRMIVEKLSSGFLHVRVDLYEANGKIYFGEMTFYHMSGMVPFEPEEWDEKFGSWITLPTK